MANKKTTLEELSDKEPNPSVAPSVAPTSIKSNEDINEWKAQYVIKLALVLLGSLITCYGGYLATRVLIEYHELAAKGIELSKPIPFPSGVALLVIPIFIAGIAFVLAASKLLAKHSKEDESNFDKLISALNPVLSAVNMYLRSKTN